MNSPQDRRQFLSSLALFGVAAVALRGTASDETSVTNVTTNDTALEFVRRYSPAATIRDGAGETLRIDAPISAFDEMAATLGGARRAGHGLVRVDGNLARFTVGGRAVEVRHQFHSA